MNLPIAHPTDIRFYLSKIGINPSDDYSVFLGYGCLRFLEHIVKENGWRLPFAAYKEERNHSILSKLFPETVQAVDCLSDSTGFWKHFANTYAQVISLSFPDFIRNVCPNFLTNPDECLHLLDSEEFGQGAFSPDIAHCLHTVFTLQCRYTESSEHAYATYQELLHQAGITPLSKAHFLELFTVVNCYSLSSAPKTRTSSNAFRAISLYKSASIPLNFQIDLYALIHSYITKDIVNPFQYLRKTKTSLPYLFDSMVSLEKVFNQSAELLRSVSPSDFLETLTTESSRKKKGAIPDAATECGFVYPQFTNYLSAINAKKVLIVNPSIPFIRQWIKSKPLSGIETHFLMQWESSAIILADEFARYPHCHFSATKSPSTSITEQYDAYLLFYRNYIDSAGQMGLATFLISAAGADSVFCLLPDERLKELAATLVDHKYFTFNPRLDAVDILPTEVFTSEPKRKVFLQVMQSHDNTNPPPINMTAYYLVEDPALKRTLIPFRKNVQTSLPALNGPDSIRTVYRNEGIISLPERQRKLPISHKFSPELTIWYTLNPPKKDYILTPKVKAYLCEYPSERKLKYGVLKRGKEIKRAHIWKTNFPEEAISSWIEYTAAFSPQIYQDAVNLIQTQYKHDPITLKTFWYLHYKKTELPLETKQGYIQNYFIRSFEAAQLKIGTSTKKDYVSAVNRFFEYRFPDEENNIRDEYIHYVWDFLCDLLDTAVEEDYYKTNPVEELCSRVRSRHNEFNELRDALTKKTFTLEEEKLFLTSALKDNTPLALGAMIRLFTGMPPAQVCALRYQDFKAIPHTGNYQFLVYQKIAKAGDSPTPLKRPEEYRRIPVAPLLAAHICKHIQNLEISFGIKIKDSDYYIVSGDFSGDAPAEVSRPFAPSTLQKHCKELISSLGIEHVSLLIPDEDGGAKESDFSQYQADIFRSNLRYRLKNTCGFTNSECDYVLGVQQKNTFAKHYCDYTNPFSQIAMLTKLSWWSALLQPVNELPARKKISSRNSHLTVSPIGTGCATAELSLSVSPFTSDASAEVTLCIDSEHGCDGSINIIKEDPAHE